MISEALIMFALVPSSFSRPASHQVHEMWWSRKRHGENRPAQPMHRYFIPADPR
jgi:hypothetical protein